MLYHSVQIGSLTLPGNVFLAPVAGYSDIAFRSVCVDCGAAFTCTEMVSSEALTRNNGKTAALMKKASNEIFYAVQIFGSNPDVMGKAASIVRQSTSCSCVDINCGCPVPKITKTGSGSALMKTPLLLHDVVYAVVKEAFPLPVTVKIRAGWDWDALNWKDCAKAIIDAGASAITIHPRTRSQGYEGKADWNILKELVSFVNARIPVFGSGDLFTPEDAKNMLLETSCSAVMFARGAMGNPFIFTETIELLKTGTITQVSTKERVLTGFKELDILIGEVGEEKACKDMRKRFCAYTKGIQGGGALRAELVHASTRADYLHTLSSYIG